MAWGHLNRTVKLGSITVEESIPEHVSTAILGNVVFFSVPYVIDTMTGAYRNIQMRFISEMTDRYIIGERSCKDKGL